MKRTIPILILLSSLQLLTAQIRSVIISEVFYDTPLNEDMLTNPKNHHNGEFIELYNPTAEDIDISGWRLEDSNPTYYWGEGPTPYIIPNSTVIKAGEMLLIAYKCYFTNQFLLSDLFPQINSNVTNNIIYQSDLILSNSGECLKLKDCNGTVIDMMSYRHSNKAKGAGNYWSLKAHNGRDAKHLLSIQRKDIHYTASSITPLQSDYYVDTPTPGKLPAGVNLAISGNAYFSDIEDTNLPVGTLAGSADVTPTGAATYTIPIELPTGTNGFQPQISISYNSQGGYGALGLGWDIGGLTSISRGLQNFYFDKTSNGTIDATTIKFDATDQLYIDGQRLILLSGTHFQSDAVYGSETENYARVKILPGSTTGIYFELTTKEGNITEYGNTNDSQLKDGDKVLAWRINKAIDVNGNEITYTYQDNGQYLQSIIYANSSIRFLYNNAEKPQKRNINGFWSKQEKLLSQIVISKREPIKVEIIQKETVQNRYLFTYDTSENYAKLDAIQPLDNTSAKLTNPTKISWGAKSSIKEVTLDKMWDGNLNNIGNGHLYSGDIDGDGYPDRIEMWEGWENSDIEADRQGYIAVTLKGNKTLPLVRFPATNESREYFHPTLTIGDINLDGKDEIIVILPIHVSRSEGVTSSRDDLYNESTNNSNNGQYQIAGLSVLSLNNNLELTKISGFDYTCDGCDENRINIGPKWTYDENYNYYSFLCNMNDDAFPDLVIVPFLRSSSYYYEKYFVDIYYGGANGLISHSYYENTHCFNEGIGNNVIGDFDANGIPDIYGFTIRSTNNMNINNRLNLIVSDTWGYHMFDEFDGDYGFDEKYSTDINNDGFTDVLVRQGKHCSKKWLLLQNNGTDLADRISLDNLHNFYNGYDFAMLLDYNGDGYQDMIIADDEYDTNGYARTVWYFYKNTGGKFEEEFVNGTFYRLVQSERPSTMNPVIMDINGDGVQDLVFGQGQVDRYNRYYKVFTMPAANKHNVVHAITNGLGQTERFTYKYLSDFNTAAQNLNSPVCDVKAPMMVVDKYQSIDGTVTSYDFKNPKTHIEGRGFLGFEQITAINSQTKQKTVSKYEIDNTYFVTNLKSQTISIGNQIISETVNTNDIISCIYGDNGIYLGSGNNPFGTQIQVSITQGKKGEKRFIPVVKRQVATDKIRNITSTTDYEFNKYGVLTKKETKTADATSITECSDFVKRTSDGLVAYLPQKMKVTNQRTGYPDYIFNSEYTYYPNGSIKTSTEMKGTYAETKTEYTYYNPQGNLYTVTVTPKEQDARTVTYGYDSYFRFVTSTATDLGTSYKTYDDFGRLKSEKGIDGITTSYEYNALGQLTKKTLPTGETINYKTEWGVNSLYKTTVYSDKVNNKTITYYDNLGREKRTEATGWKGAILQSFTEYDPLTLKVLKYIKPHYESETEVYTAYKYDDYLQRVTQETVFDGNNTLTTKYDYSADSEGKLTVTAPDGTQTVSVKNALGEVVQRTDPGGTITYEYNALGKPFTITTNGATTSITYDDAGRQKTLTDPDAGTITYEYYADGQLKTQKNANKDITSFTYDNAGRTDTKTVKDYDFETNALLSTTETKYTYVESGNGIGQVLNIIMKENGNIVHTQIYNYWENQLLKTVIDKYNGKTFPYSYIYDDLWRPKNKTTPSGLTTTNEYNEYGDLYRIKTGNTVLWEGTAQNGNGQFTKYKVNNGNVITDNIYNPRGELTDIQTKKGTAFIQNNHYDYNTQTGNLTARNDLLNNRNETFEYDNLDRLTKAYLNNALQYEMTYHLNGNIDYKKDVGQYRYEDDRPHAMRGIIGAAEYGVTNEKQFITYTAFNKVSEILQGTDISNITKVYQIRYGLDEQRIYSYYSNHETNETRERYYIGSYERDIDQNNNITETDYISSPCGLIAMVKNGAIYYIHTDRQGSIERITDSNGTMVSNYAYTPWGGRILLAGTNITDRGYTGHEHLPALGLINMNGRVYDPVLARFLSPDPYVQAPDYTQNFNRYSYCYNNPFKYTDPDGEWIHIVIGAVVGGVINWATHGFQFTWKGLGYFGVGAIAGAASAGIGAGASSLLAGGSFGAGFIGSSTAASAGASFLSSAAISGSAATASGLTTGFGNALLGGQNFGQAMWSGVKDGFISGTIGGVTGGIVGGISAVRHGGDFLTGKGAIYDQVALNGTTQTAVSEENYNKYRELNGEVNDLNLQDRYADEFNLRKGDVGVQKITTEELRTEGRYMSTLGYYTNDAKQQINGFTYDLGMGRSEIHISPAILYSDTYTFRATAGHELIHAIHINMGLNEKYTEIVAHRYSVSVALKSGNYISYINRMHNAISLNYLGDVPSAYNISLANILRFRLW